MEIEHEVINNQKLMHFEIHEGDNTASLEYRFYRKSIALMHTGVPESMEGKGVGSALVKYAFNFAKEHEKPVIIYCPFVLVYLKNHPELNELLDKAFHR